MTDYIVYFSPTACSRVAMTALEEAGVPYQDRLINTGANVQNSPEYLAVNRKGKVPALSIDGQVLTENVAILSYLNERYPEARLLPRGEDSLVRARGISDLAWCASTLHIEVRQCRAPHKLTTGDPTAVRADGMEKFAKECAYISERLGEDGWWYGDAWSVVDTYLYWAGSTAALGGFPLQDYPRLAAHAERVRARPSFQRMLKRERDAVVRDKLPIDPASL